MRRAVLVLAAVPVLLVAGLALAYRPVAAALCPACFGLARVAPGLWAEAAAPAEWRAALPGLWTAARAGVADLGPGPAWVRVLVCQSPACARRLFGAARHPRGLTLGGAGVAVVALVADPELAPVMRHEAAHLALNARAGLPALVSNRFPAWVNEGLAVLASDLPMAVTPSDCTDAAGPLIADPGAFGRAASASVGVYRVSACAVLAYAQALGGLGAVLAAIDGLGWRGVMPPAPGAGAP